MTSDIVMRLGLDGQIPYIYYKLNEGVDACLSFSFLDSHNIPAEASVTELLSKSLLGIMRIRRTGTMKRRMLSVLLSVMLVIATICVSNMPSAAVEPDDEMMQNDMWTAETLENSEVTTEEVAEEGTETTTEEVTKETMEGAENPAESITSTETIVDEENSEPQTDTANEISDEKNGEENGDAITELDAVELGVDMETAGDIENDEISVENSDEDMMLSDEVVPEYMSNGIAVNKLDNVSFDFYDWDGFDEGEKEDWFLIEAINRNEVDVYLSCMRGYVTDEKGNNHNVPVSVKRSKNDITPDMNGYWVTNDINGYWGYNNESVLTDESVLLSPRVYADFYVGFTVPAELNGNFSVSIYAEFVKLDDISGKVVALYSDTKTYFKYDRVINVENSNYFISENGKGDLGNIDIDVWHDGNALISGTEANFYIKISNKNDFDVDIMRIKIFCTRDNEGVVLELTDSDGKSIINNPSWGYSCISFTEGKTDIRAGETVTYSAKCTLYSNDSGKIQPVCFYIYLGEDVLYPVNRYHYNCVFNPLNGDTPIVSIDKKDETAPDIKLDAESYASLINSIFTEFEIKSGKHLKADLIVAAVQEADIEQSELEAIKAAAKKRKIAIILDMNIVKFIDGILSGNVNQLDKEIRMTIDVPKAFQADNRKFSIIRLHDGIAEELADLDDNPNTVTFTTGKFSLYALIYEDVEETVVEPPKNDVSDATITPVETADKTQQATSPNTGDMTPIAVVFIVMLMSAFFAVICAKLIKKNK